MALPLAAALTLAFAGLAAGQPSSPDSDPADGYYKLNFNPTVGVAIIAIITAIFFLAFFSLYLRNCGERAREGAPARSASLRGIGAAIRSRRWRQRGLDADVVTSFPTMKYADVKEHHEGERGVSLECAVCLCEFEDDETLKLIPKCHHVFHPDCIDTWLAGHATCPVCRANLAVTDPVVKEPAAVPPPAEDEANQETAPPAAAVITVDDGEADLEAAELQRIGSVKRALRSKSAALRRSHTTGHSLAAARPPAPNGDRYTLRVPGNVLREIIAAGEVSRTASLARYRLEGSSRRGYRSGSVRGEGSNRGRSIQLGRLERWPSSLMRTLSARWGVGSKSGEPSPTAAAGTSRRVIV